MKNEYFNLAKREKKNLSLRLVSFKFIIYFHEIMKKKCNSLIENSETNYVRRVSFLNRFPLEIYLICPSFIIPES